MKKFSLTFKFSTLTALFSVLVFSQSVFAQTSITSGLWNSTGTWVGGVIPPAGATVTIAAGHTVTVATAGDINTTNTITIQNGGILNLTNGNTNAATFIVDAGGTLTLNGGTLNITTATINGNYNHNMNGGVIPTATWGANSNCNIFGITTTPLGGASFAQTFGNFTWNCTGQTVTQNTGAGAAMNVAGNFTINNTNSSALVFARNLNIAGNYTDNVGTAFLDFYTNGVTTTFNGIGTQTLTVGAFNTRFHNLVVNKSSDIVDVSGTPSSNIIVSNALTLTNGRIRLNTTNLSYAGTPPNITRTNGWVETQNTGLGGFFLYNAGSPATNVTFPVGDATNYQPFFIANITASGALVGFGPPTISVPSGGVGSWTVRTFAGTSAVGILDPQGGTLTAASKIHINPNYAGTWTTVTTNYSAPNYTSASAVTTGNIDEFSVYSLPIPTITSFSPTSGAAGSTAVTIIGTNFNPSGPNDVFFGAVKVTGTANPAGTQITVTVPNGATSVTPIVVRNNANGFQGSSLTAVTTKRFTVTNTPNLSPLVTNYSPSNFTTGTGPRATTVGDFNNDGNPDIAIVNQGSDNVSIRLGDGAGNFANTATIPLPLIGAFPFDIATGDFNGDGIADLATANYGTNDVSILLGDGSGDFPTVNNFPIFINYQNPVAVALADFNNDGHLDFAVGNTNGTPIDGGVSVRFGDGTGTNFTGTVDLTSADPTALAIGDFDNDGDIDIAVGEGNSSNNLYIWTNNGAGAFTGPAISTVGGGAVESMASGHFNADSNVDLVIGTITTNSAYLYTGNGAGAFVLTATVPTTTVPRSMVIGDFNGDGSSDFATAHGGSGNNVQITLGNGAGAFTTPRIIPFTGAFGISQGDFNNDGRADLAAVNFSGTGGTALIYDPTVAFKTTWITTDGEITIPTTGGGYNYSISWTNLTNAGVGDGSITGQTGNYTITGLENGSTYRIEISGTFPRFFMNNNATERTKLRTIEQWGDIAWTSMQNAFAGCSNLQITATDAPNLAGVTDMSGMFFQCTAFTGNASMNTWNTSTVTNMGTMFMQSSFNQPLNNWNTSAVVTMIQMFRATPFNQDLNLWNTANVQDMSFMFSDCPTFNGNISTWNTANVLGMTQMFYNCAAFNSDISGWNTGLVTDMQYMFTGCSAFNANISGWNTGNVTNMYNMFLVASSFDRSLATWNMGSVVNAQFMLDGCGMSQANYEATLIGWAGQTLQPNITLGAIGRTYCSPAAVTARTTLTTAPKNWIVVGDALSCPFITTWITTDGTITIPTTGGGYNYNVTWTNLTNAGVGDGSITGQTGNYTITGLENGSTYRVEISGTFPHFYINNDVTNAPKLRTIEQWGDIAWASMANAFHGCSNLTYNATDVPNLAGVTNMSYMFTNCSSFNGNASMNTWNTTSITDMSYLFAGASVFNQDISGWDVSNITNMSGMFLLASAFNQNISGWTTNNVTSMFAMFQDAVAFNQNIGGWNTTTVTNMSYLFAGATVFNQDISGWNTAAVTDMSYMFNNAPTFNQNIGGWNTAAVTNMSNMFNVATAFNQSLATWDIGNVTNMTNMLNNSGLSQANYDATLIGWAAQTVQVGVNLGAAGLQYCAGAAARTTLTNTPNNWVITGDVLSCAGYFSRKTGNWSDVTAGDGTWSTIAVGGASCDCTPVAGADVLIDAAHTITADVSTNTNSIALGGTLDLQDLTHTFTDINNNGGAGILRIGGGTAAGTIAGTTGTFFTTATNTVVFDGTALYALPNRNYPTLEITGTGGRTLGGGPVDILGNLNATGGSATLSSTATINFPNAGILPHLIQGTLGDQINLTDVNINGNTEVNAGFGFNFNGVITVNTGITFTNNSAFFQANSATSNITGAGTFVNANVVYWLSDITPSVANFDAITNANTVVYQAGIAPPRNTTYDLLFFRNTRSTTSGTIIANQIIFDNFASPSALNLATGTDITVNNNLTLANPNGSTIDFGTGNATIYVGGDLLASTVGATITHNAGIGATQLLSLAGANNALNAFNNATLSGTSQVTYNGTNQQVFASPNYQNLEIAGGGVKTLSGNTTVSGTLILGNGRLQLGGNDLTLINPAVSSQLTGAPYTTSWIETNGTGSLIRQGADTNVDFPVGDNTAVRLLTLSNTDAGNNTVRFNPTIAPVITGTNPAAGMWSINTNVATDLTFSNVGGTADATSEIHYDNAGWTALTTTGGRPPYIAAGIAFTGADQNFTIFTPAAATYYSVGTGNWNNAASWSTVCGGAGGAGVPTAIDNVVICTGTNITLASTSACANLTIEATGALELANQDFTVNGTSTIDGNLRDTQNGGINTFTGNVTVNTGGTFEATNINSTFNFGANITNSGTFDLQSNNTISLNGIGATITANTNMNFNGGFVGTTNFNANCSLTGAGTIIFSAAFNNVAAGVTVTNNANVDFFYANPVAASPASTFINGANAFLTLRGVNLPMNGGIFNANAVNNTVSYSRNAIQDILGGITYHHLEVYTNTKTIVGGNIIINGNLSISNAPVTVFDANNFNINIRGNWLTQVGSSFVGGTGTVTFDGNIAQSITGATTFNNLAINQVPANILTVNNPITITGTLSLTNGRLQLGPNNLTLNNPTVALQLLGTPYATSWIETNGLGSLIRQGAVTGMDFPVGDATGVRLVSMTISGAGSNTVRFAPAIAPPIVGTNPAAGMWIINRPAGTTNLLFSNVGGTADATSQIHSGGWTALATNVVLPNYTTTAGVAFTGTAQNFTIFTPSPVTPPTVQSFDIRFLSVTANTVGLQWTNGNGANRIVVASTSNVFTPPTDGVAYTVGQTIGSGRVVYIGNGSIATAYGLIPETKYFFHVFDYNGTGTLTAYNISPAANNPNSITTLAVPPQNQPTNLVISDITPTSAKAMFTIATPVPAGSVAVIRKPDIDRLAPADGQPLTVGSLFFNGQIVVFSGTGNSFDLSNLEPFTTYIVEVYAYNGSGASITYKKDNPLSAQFTTSALLPVLISLDINEKEVGDNAFTLQAIGSNFTSKTIIRWQGKDLSTTFINKNSLSAQVPRDLLSEAGVFNIAAFTPPTGGGESNALPFQVIAVTNISSLPVVSRTVPPDKNDHLLHRIAFEVAGGDVSLKEIKFTTNGSYQITDLKNVAFTLKYSTDESLDNSDVTLATSTAINANGNITFDFSRTQPAPQLPKNKTSFLLLTVNISKDAKAGNEIGIAPISFDNIQFSAKVAKRGINPASAGTTQKIISVTPSPQDYSALIKFFTELGGTDWEESWNLNNPVNTWKGVELDEDGRVFAINLPNNNLVGELSNALTNEGVLVSTNLRYLNLSGNRIKGQIPPNLGNLTDLEYLDLSKNELSGSIPPSIGNLTKLVTLWLGYNDLNSIDIDFSRLTNLRNLFLQFNEFDKLPDNIGELQNLEVLSLKGNKFKTLPSTLGRLGKLKYLDISENELEQVPSGITNLTELEGLLMHANFFKTIPSDLLNLKKLNLFTTYDNFLEFGSLEPLRVWWSGQSKMDITYSPQARIGRSQEITVEVGSPFTFNLPVTGTANRYQWFKNGVSVSVSNNSSLTIPSVSVQDVGIYTLRVTNNLVPDLVLQSYEMLLSVDCGSARQTIKPKITIEGSSVFCNNEPVNTRLTTEVRSEISRYQWFLDGVLIANANSNSIAVSDAGKYKVQIFTNDGCSLFSDAEATITKLPAFTVNITQNQGVLVAGVANRVISNYEWFLNGNLIPNASQARYLPIERGNYTVRVTDVDGCRSTSAIEVVSSVTSSEESIYEGEIKVYPNPSEAIFYLEVGKEKAIKIQLFNALGQFFNQKIRPLQGNRYEINLENQAWGMYFIEVTYQNGKVIKKLVKE
ncbi:BspA family leucine-rich repeat surface protein [Thermoflexibacter ruber]|uniref:Surface protein n=1 Tax=Thermoflexibacter ruber TaxID=1003 RepID=A0A1I2DWU2_9BACT|nr:BspA family leucine-rich repeat surface protein [Thermoflexibacter ruber]SFE85094.1 surface protein [Thermoflexibacter ruber]